MRVFRRHASCVFLGAALSACSSPAPVAELPAGPAPLSGVFDGGQVSAHALPLAVFRTKPAADAADTIRGNTGLLVQFSMCRSRPGDPDDNLKFTYDWTDDGAVDYYGLCRQSFRYSTSRAGLAEQARVCVSDRRGNETCKVFYIRLGRASM
jgi:hypothetical protein